MKRRREEERECEKERWLGWGGRCVCLLGGSGGMWSFGLLMASGISHRRGRGGSPLTQHAFTQPGASQRYMQTDPAWPPDRPPNNRCPLCPPQSPEAHTHTLCTDTHAPPPGHSALRSYGEMSLNRRRQRRPVLARHGHTSPLALRCVGDEESVPSSLPALGAESHRGLILTQRASHPLSCILGLSPRMPSRNTVPVVGWLHPFQSRSLVARRSISCSNSRSPYPRCVLSTGAGPVQATRVLGAMSSLSLRHIHLLPVPWEPVHMLAGLLLTPQNAYGVVSPDVWVVVCSMDSRSIQGPPPRRPKSSSLPRVSDLRQLRMRGPRVPETLPKSKTGMSLFCDLWRKTMGRACRLAVAGCIGSWYESGNGRSTWKYLPWAFGGTRGQARYTVAK